MRLPVLLTISIVAVLAGSLMLTGIFSTTSIFVGQGHDYHVQQAGAQALPFEVRDRFSEKKLVGDANNIKVTEDFVDPENHCEFCTLIEYTPGAHGMAGFAYENDAGLDLTDAKKMRFWAMGEEGNEKIKFKIAGKKDIDNLQDRPANRPVTNGEEDIFKSESFALTTQEVTLANDWKRYEVDLSGVSLDAITHPFGIELLSKGNGAQKQIIYIKGLVIDDEPVQGSYALATTKQSQVITRQQQPLVIGIISNETEGVAPATFKFEANITGGTEPYSSLWNFGDDSKDNEEETVFHTFSRPGSYDITLTVTDSNDQIASESVNINVEEDSETEVENEAIEEQAD